MGFETENEALNYYSKHQNETGYPNTIIINFKSNAASKHFDYVLRTQEEMPSKKIEIPKQRSKAYRLFIHNPFVLVQHCLNMKFIKHIVKDKLDNTTVSHVLKY